MRVGIFTFPNSTSYGAELQMYALYHAVESLGHTPEVVNYFNAYMKAEKHNSRKSWSRRALSRLLHHRLHRSFSRFEKTRMERYPKTPLCDPDGLPKLSSRYDAVICGSDQVWNPDITGSDLSYFLNFCDENTRRVAYAPSFGIEEFSPDFSDAIGPELEKFHALSVREAPGQALIAQLTGKNAPLVTDPTLLLSADDWTKLENPHPAGDGAYILYYTIRTSTDLWERCKAFARETGLKIVVVGGNPLKKWKQRDQSIQYAVDISPEQWLYLVHHARYVVTNSFHGTAFSVNFRKDFYVGLPARANSRLVQITQALGLTDRIVGEEALHPAPVDYSVADRVLPQMRQASMDYLTQALN